jgi:beta-1,2-mannobiose phosphorylase / 1,2-beta-oligomannan phosphorylase
MIPYRIERLGVLMRPDPSLDIEAEGVLNPATGRDPDGRLWLLPRLVAAGNVSRIGLAEILVEGGVPVGVRREGVVLSPDEGWEHGLDHGGVEDPRVTWIPTLGLHVMTYVAFGPLGPRPALAVSADLRAWRRLGPVHFEYEPDLHTDLNLFHNKDLVFFPEPVPGPDGGPAYALLHRPMWNLGKALGGMYPPAGTTDARVGIWISYIAVDQAMADVRALTHVSGHRAVALPEYDWEAVRIGAGPPPVRVPEGWLLIHHGISGTEVEGWGPQQDLIYAAGAMLLDPADPGRLIARTPRPWLEPLEAEERRGTMPNVVFPTAIEEVDGQRLVFYGMADSSIGVARLKEAQ